jgi:hypothetical protein
MSELLHAKVALSSDMDWVLRAPLGRDVKVICNLKPYTGTADVWCVER